jgi:protein-serine/threonine kinase
MKHPFITKLHFAFQTDVKLFLVLEYCPGGDLGNLLSKKRRVSEDVARLYIGEIILALEALHRDLIIYRDLKPENVILD